MPADPQNWFLTAAGRGNPSTTLDSRHFDGKAWTSGNHVEPLVHGAVYFRALFERVERMRAGDLLLFTDWRGDPDELLDGPGSEVGPVFAAAAARGVDVRGLVWRSHLDRFQFSVTENRHLGEEIEAAGGECLLDQRVRPGGSHHQKLVVLRHPDRPSEDVAFIGGIDLCHSRHDDRDHAGDPQHQPMAAVYGSRPPWHDIQLAVSGPAVGDAELVFRERWDDPTPLSLNPVHVIGDKLRRDDWRPKPLPPQLPDPPRTGTFAVQLLRTYPVRRPRYPFAPRGEHSVARGYAHALAGARSLVYVEDQYLWSAPVAEVFAAALRRSQQLRMIAVIPRFPDQDGRASMPPNLVGREPALRILREAGGDRFAVYGIENDAGVPIYVHAKVCIVDDTWACVGSANLNRRSWTHDSELSCAVVDEDGDAWARPLRLELAREHLGYRPDAGDELDDPVETFRRFADSATQLDGWHESGRATARPRGQLRRYTQAPISAATRAWAEPLYRVLYDPNGA